MFTSWLDLPIERQSQLKIERGKARKNRISRLIGAGNQMGMTALLGQGTVLHRQDESSAFASSDMAH
ncbi:MAG: hypothetical protein CMH52_05295 [Myxococcales bacterium]|nr:hypothetical protein [Myxococcales bacterium]